jgi:hypothetical protein
LHELFYYSDGLLYRRVSSRGKAKAGDVVGTIGGGGYLRVNVDGKLYNVHRLIYLMFHGELPNLIDHIDGNQLNNRIENLRAATKSQNAYNTRMFVSNTSGAKGVHWDKRSGKWMVRVRHNNERMYFGLFEDLELAELVAIEARNKYHGNFANHG